MERKRKGKCPLSPQARILVVCLGICLIVAAIWFLLEGKRAGTVAVSPADPVQAGDGGQTVSFTDALGQEISIPQPRRVVSLMGSFTEIWLLAGGRDSLVGTAVDAQDKRDLGLPESVVSVGTYQSPSLEAILAQSPDLVLLSSETVRTDNHVAFKNSLTAAGIPAAYFSVTHFDNYLGMLDICCQLTGDQQAYSQNGLEVQSEIDQILEQYRLETSPTVLLLVTYSGGIRPQASTTMTGGMLAQLGCRNIIDDYPSLLKDFSMESVMEIDPDYIFVIPMGYSDEDALRALTTSVEDNPAWNSLSAVKNKRYHPLPPEKFMFKPNNRWADSYRYLGEFLKNNPANSPL